MSTNTPLVIYHAPCTDGFTAAWACHKAHPDWEFHPQSHGDPFKIMDAYNRDVYLLDFCFPRQDMISLACVAASITVLDHHKTAVQNMADFDAVLRDLKLDIPVNLIFDMARSGAMMSWEHFHPGEPAPQMVRHVQDRDLWNFEIEGTKEVHAAMSAYAQTFENWDLIERTHSSVLVSDGMAILRRHERAVETLIEEGLHHIEMAGELIPVVNAPPMYASDIGHALAQNAPFAATYYDAKGGARWWSLRSRKDGGADVSEIAKRYGGGGHHNAAGFQTKTIWLGEQNA